MIPLKDDVIEAFRILLGREPESDAVIRQMQAAHASVMQLAAALMRSEEYRARTFPPDRPGAEFRPVLERFRREAVADQHAFVDWIGVRTDRRLDPDFAARGDRLEPAHLDEAEIAVRAAAFLAAEAAPRRFLAADIGAGWGRWAVVAMVAARVRGLTDITLAAAETQPDRFALLGRHLSGNGFDPGAQRLSNVVVAPTDGEASFPVIDAEDRSAAEAAFEPAEERPGVAYRRMPARALVGLLGELGATADICHVDLPRAEAILEPALPALAGFAKALIVRTGGRQLEAWLHESLPRHGWRLDTDVPSVFAGPDAAVRRGMQLWRAPAVV